MRIKKYLYVLRPVLACKWIEQQGGPPPMAFEDLLDRLIPAGGLREAIDALLAKKRISAEVDDGPRIPAISEFLEREMERMEASTPMLESSRGGSAVLDAFFRRVVTAP